MSYGYNNNQGYPYQQGGYQGYSPSAQHRPPPPGTPQQQQQGYGSYGRPPPPQMNQGGYPPQQNYGKYSIGIKRERENQTLMCTFRQTTWTTWLSTRCGCTIMGLVYSG